jgi:hypothetical protein
MSCENRVKALEMSPEVGHLVRKHGESVGDVPESGTFRTKTGSNVRGVPECGTCRAKTGVKRWRCPRMWDISDENRGKTLEVSQNVGHLVRKWGQSVGGVPGSGTSRSKLGVKRWRCPRMWDISDENGVKTLEVSLKVGHLVRKPG